MSKETKTTLAVIFGALLGASFYMGTLNAMVNDKCGFTRYIEYMPGYYIACKLFEVHK